MINTDLQTFWSCSLDCSAPQPNDHVRAKAILRPSPFQACPWASPHAPRYLEGWQKSHWNNTNADLLCYLCNFPATQGHCIEPEPLSPKTCGSPPHWQRDPDVLRVSLGNSSGVRINQTGGPMWHHWRFQKSPTCSPFSWGSYNTYQERRNEACHHGKAVGTSELLPPRLPAAGLWSTRVCHPSNNQKPPGSGIQEWCTVANQGHTLKLPSVLSHGVRHS